MSLPRLATILLACATAPAALAIDYSVESNIDGNVSHNDNLRMTERDQTSVNKYQIVPAITLKSASERTDIALTSTFFFNRYSESAFNSDDQKFDLNLQHSFETSSLVLSGLVNRQSTTTSEELTSGRVGTRAERTELYQIAPAWTYFLNETNSIQLSAAHTKQHYRARNYTGYENSVAGVDWVYVLNERVKTVLSGYYTRYQSEDIDFSVPAFDTSYAYFGERILRGYFGEQGYSTRTKEKKVQLGVDYQLSEATLLQARFGRSNSETSHPISGNDSFCSNPVYLELRAIYAFEGLNLGGICATEDTDDRLTTAQVTWNWRSERQQFQINGTKSTQPSSNGYVVDALLVRSYWSYNLTERDQLSAALSLVRNRAINEDEDDVLNRSIADRDYSSISLNYRRRLSEEWSTVVGYQYNRQKYNEVDVKAHANIFSIGIRYQPRAWHWAR